MGTPLEVVCEIEPATGPDLRMVRHQIGVLSSVSSTFLIPDNHIGRATVSSIAVAHEVLLMGGRAIACLDAWDRNTLGFRRARRPPRPMAFASFCSFTGDRPESGRRSDDFNARSMIDQARRFLPSTTPSLIESVSGCRRALVHYPHGRAMPTSFSPRSASPGNSFSAGERWSPSTGRVMWCCDGGRQRWHGSKAECRNTAARCPGSGYSPNWTNSSAGVELAELAPPGARFRFLRRRAPHSRRSLPGDSPQTRESAERTHASPPITTALL